jgi:hypothetical protein
MGHKTPHYRAPPSVHTTQTQLASALPPTEQDTFVLDALPLLQLVWFSTNQRNYQRLPTIAISEPDIRKAVPTLASSVGTLHCADAINNTHGPSVAATATSPLQHDAYTTPIDEDSVLSDDLKPAAAPPQCHTSPNTIPPSPAPEKGKPIETTADTTPNITATT